MHIYIYKHIYRVVHVQREALGRDLQKIGTSKNRVRRVVFLKYCTYIYVYISVYPYTLLSLYIYTKLFICTYIYMYIYTHTYIHTYKQKYIRVVHVQREPLGGNLCGRGNELGRYR